MLAGPAADKRQRHCKRTGCACGDDNLSSVHYPTPFKRKCVIELCIVLHNCKSIGAKPCDIGYSIALRIRHMRALAIYAGHPQTRLHEGSSWCRVADWLAEWKILSIPAYECFCAMRTKSYANPSPVHLTHSFAAAPNAQSKPKRRNHVRTKEFHNGKHQEPEEAQHHQREVPSA